VLKVVKKCFCQIICLFFYLSGGVAFGSKIPEGNPMDFKALQTLVEPIRATSNEPPSSLGKGSFA
jgi:hypothetical protein